MLVRSAPRANNYFSVFLLVISLLLAKLMLASSLSTSSKSKRQILKLVSCQTGFSKREKKEKKVNFKTASLKVKNAKKVKRLNTGENSCLKTDKQKELFIKESPNNSFHR